MFAMQRDDRRTGFFVQPGVRVSHAGLHSETIDRDARLRRAQSEIAQKPDVSGRA